MRTYSHFLITAAVEKLFPRIPIVKSAFLWGSIAPDIPLWLLSIGSFLYFHYYQGWNLSRTFSYVFDDLFFSNPFWIASHNFLHSPLLLIVAIAVVLPRYRHINSLSRWLFWFFLACLFHSVIDILTHVNDGPLLLFPLDWTTRFQSAVSYWDERYYGQAFTQVENTLNFILLIYLFGMSLFRYLRRFYPKRDC